MSAVGFREAYADAIDVRLADGLMVKVSSLAGLGLLKLLPGPTVTLSAKTAGLGALP